MTQRWWAPGAPSPVPDAFSKSLLEPGGQPRLDLGLALLAYHRVGAAACEASRDEDSLIQNLVTARASFAKPMVESISKCLTEGESYAGLLVRDFADEAEEGALVLYRAAVSKGVPPTLAAQRVGAVFGVPARELGTYRTLACTPQTSPVAIADAADRVLMEYVEKVCDEEIEQPLEIVSKDTATERETDTPVIRRSKPGVLRRDDPRTDYYDARDEGGRFSAVPGVLRRTTGMGGSAPAEVGTTAADKVKAVTRQTRKVRQVRQVSRPQDKPKRGELKRTAMKPGLLRNKTKAQLKRLEGNLRKKDYDGPDEEGNGSWLDRLPDADSRGFTSMDAAFAMHLSEPQMRELLKNSFGGGTNVLDQHTFRMGRLQENIDITPQQFDSFDQLHDQTIDTLNTFEQQIEGVGPPERSIGLSDQTYQDPVQRDRVHRRLVQEAAEIRGIDMQTADPDEQMAIEQLWKSVSFHQDLQDDGNSWVAVLYDPDKPDMGMLTVNRVVIMDARGKSVGDKIKFDPNQAFSLGTQVTEMWDNEENVLVRTWEAFPLTEEEVMRRKRYGSRGYAGETWRDGRQGPYDYQVKKADDPRTTYYDHRAASGQFALLEDDGVVPVIRRSPGVLRRTEPEVKPKARQRQVRRVRQVRRTTQSPESFNAPIKRKELKRTRRPLSRKSQEMLAQEFGPPLKPDFGFEGGRQYMIMPARTMSTSLHLWGASEDSTEVPITRSDLSSMLKSSGHDPEVAPRVAAQVVEEGVSRLNPDEQSIVIETLQDPKPGEIQAVARRLFDEMPMLQQITVEELPGGAGWAFYSHGEAVRPTTVIEVDPHTDLDKPLALLNEGIRRQVDMHDTDMTMTITQQDGTVAEVPYGKRLTRAQTQRWRVINQSKPAT